MKKENRKNLIVAACWLAAFVFWTVLVCFADVQPIGPLESSVGLAGLNGFLHQLTGVHIMLYTLTDQLSLIPLLLVLSFGLLGLCQWIQRKSLLKVDLNILALGGFYLITAAFFLLFEVWVINYRPVLIDGILEPSYPSSTTLLVMCVMPTAAMQLRSRVRHALLRSVITGLITAFTVLMVIARLISGVHWATDIVGGILLSTGLVTAYRAVTGLT